MPNDLIQVQNTDMTGFDPMAAFGGGEELILRPTRMELTQPINASDGLVAGKYTDTQSKDQRSELIIVPLLFQKGRILFAPDDGSGTNTKPICRSKNGLVPEVGEGLTPQAANCAKCPMSQWKKVNGQNIKPPCSQTMTLLFIDREYNFLYKFGMKRTNYKAATDLLETIKKTMLMAKAKGRTLFPFELECKMSATLINKGTRKYYVTNFSAPRLIQADNSVISGYAELFQKFVLGGPLEDDDVDPVDQAINDAVPEFIDA